MSKVDFKKLPHLQAKVGQFRVLEVPPAHYLMIEGAGDPNSAPVYQQSLASIYPLAYALKFASKRELGRDYVVPPLQGRWWADDMTAFTTARDKSQWRWVMMLLVPDWITPDLYQAARESVARKAPLLEQVGLHLLDEGLCVQTLHIGPYDAEGPTLAAMHTEFIPSQQLAMRGLHHEIYLSDPRRSSPDKLRTILRQPVARLGPAQP